jgi:hypothetical protein
LTNGTAGSDYTTLQNVELCSCGCNYGTVSVPTTADAIDEVTENFSIVSGAATGTINDNNAWPTVATISPSKEGCCCIQLYIKQPF